MWFIFVGGCDGCSELVLNQKRSDLRAVLYEDFGKPLRVETVDDPTSGEGDVIVKVEASGICRSDWHGWLGHDPDIVELPHVPGHELAGTVEAVGAGVERFAPGDRVTVPFVSGCGACPECKTGNHQVCDYQYQPGFTGWGSFAEFVSIKYADTNLVRLPEEIDFVTAASLGCRFGTSYRAVTAQGRVTEGDWVAVHGCGGVGLSAVMIANALGARVIGVDIDKGVLDLAKALGADETIDASSGIDIPGAIRELTGRGADVSIDALGSSVTCANSIRCLRKRGRHIQVGLLAGEDYHPSLPMEWVIAWELEIVGSHGIQAAKYETMFEMIVSGLVDPRRLIGGTVSLDDAPKIIENMGNFGSVGIMVIDRF